MKMYFVNKSSRLNLKDKLKKCEEKFERRNYTFQSSCILKAPQNDSAE
jgi:hypothetical protein